MKEWKEYAIREVSVNIFSGGTPSTKNLKYYNGNIPWLNTKEINFCRIYNTISCISELGISNSAAKWVPEDSVIVAMYGVTAGKVATNALPLTTNQACCNIVINKENFDFKFIYYALSNSYFKLKNLASGAAQQNLNLDIISNFVISIPSFPEQRAIAAVLSSLDDKIDLLHRKNATLEAMAEALFIELFINNAGNSEIESITKYINFNPGYSLKKGEVAQFLEMSNLNTNSFHPSEVTQKNFSSGMKFMNKDTLLARITPCLENGKACYVTFLAKNEVGWGSTEYIVMRPIAKLHPLFAYCLAKSEDFRGYAENCLQGSSGRQRVDLHHLQQYQINSMTNEKLEKFNALAEMIEPKLHNNYIQIQTLEKLRDTLLPKLMSGEVRVALD